MKKEYPPIELGSPGEEISKKDLQAIKQRFKILQQIRINRIQEFLHARQRIFLDLLPLLFHRNHPILPGFVSLETPSGIPDYSPVAKTIKAAKKISRSFTYRGHSSRRGAIEGLYLMGSVGSIAFSKTSDMDIWLCHQPDLSAEKIHELQKKASAIEKWAASLGLEVHFFLMDSHKFRLGEDTPISKESSGKTQHYLLLEEFYRTAVYIAGKSPAWWFVPPHEEHNYSNYIRHLKDNRFVYEQDLIDFGGLDFVPAEEFISATLWHIYKSLASPHKSLLKLLLMECYASEYPHTQWLCQEIKQAIYQGTFADIDLDPYLLIYQKVDAYLQKNASVGRLALARESFYLKIMGSSATVMDSQSRAIREAYLQKVAADWNWPKSTLMDLKKQHSWDIKKATREHAIIVQQLSQCFRMINGFAIDHVYKQKHEVSLDEKLIGRKLYSFLEKKPGKIEIITTRKSVYAKEYELSIVETPFADGVQGWSLYTKKVQPFHLEESEALQKSRSLMEILCWIVINGLYHRYLLIHFSSESLHLSRDDLHGILGQLDGFFAHHFNHDNSLEAYQTAKNQLASLIVINLGLVNEEVREDGLCTMSERSNPLSYGANRQCFIQTLDKVSVSSWEEITTSHYQGLDGFFTCLVDIINNSRMPSPADSLVVVCQTPIRAKSISLRLETIFKTLVELFARPKQQILQRYVLVGENSHYLFQMTNKVLGFNELGSKEHLLKELARPNDKFSPVHFDPTVLENTPIPLIYRFNKAKVIQLFYHEHKSGITMYVLDERGALFTQYHEKSDANQLLAQYSEFLRAILKRNLFESLLSIEYYEIQKNSLGLLSCNQIYLKTPQADKQLKLRIAGETTVNGIIYTIYCNEAEFSSLYYGKQLFLEVYHYILQYRQSQQDYPIYISDIDLPLSAFHIDSMEALQTSHYLNYKQKIETRLNVCPENA